MKIWDSVYIFGASYIHPFRGQKRTLKNVHVLLVATAKNTFCFSDRLTTFVEKKTPSLAEPSSSSSGNVSKPAIVFRKRKVANQEFARKRDEDN